METYKILTGKERLNLKTFFQLFQPRLNSNLARTAGLLSCACEDGLVTSYRVIPWLHVANNSQQWK